MAKALTLLVLLALATTVFRPGEAQSRASTVPLPQYERIAKALSRYRLLVEKDDGTSLPVTDEPVHPGDSYDGTPCLIRLLSLLGDLPENMATADSELYDGELVEAVKRFQSRHELQPDGQIGPETFQELNTPLGVRVHQLEVALEVWRRHPYDPRRPAIVVNLPEFRLRAFSGAGAGEPELEMKVVVGQAADHESPVLRSELETVIFRPYWAVPESIQRNELVPEISRNRSWVSANNFEVVTAGGEVAEGGAVSDDMLAGLSNGELQLRQKPGPKNTLGLVKFQFPNKYGICMHDTSARWLFQKERRDLSHGCIRVEKPEKLAEWVLRGQPGWTPERIDAAIHGTDSIAVNVKRPIQVVILYSTAWVMSNGEVHFFRDIYGEGGVPENELESQRK